MMCLFNPISLLFDPLIVARLTCGRGRGGEVASVREPSNLVRTCRFESENTVSRKFPWCTSGFFIICTSRLQAVGSSWRYKGLHTIVSICVSSREMIRPLLVSSPESVPSSELVVSALYVFTLNEDDLEEPGIDYRVDPGIKFSSRAVALSMD